MQDVHPPFHYLGVPLKYGDLFKATRPIVMFFEKPKVTLKTAVVERTTFSCCLDPGTLMLFVDLKKALMSIPFKNYDKYRSFDMHFFVGPTSGINEGWSLMNKNMVCGVEQIEIQKELSILGILKIS